MKTLTVTTLCIVIAITVASLRAAEVSDESCKAALAANCTRCHGAVKICNKLKDTSMDAGKWQTIVARMGKKAGLAQDVQDAVHACLTASADPGKLVCQ